MEPALPPAHEDTEEVRRFIEACRRREAELARLHRSDEQTAAQSADLVRLMLEFVPLSVEQAPKRSLLSRLVPARRVWR